MHGGREEEGGNASGRRLDASALYIEKSAVAALRSALRFVPDRHAHQQALESPSLGTGRRGDAANDPGARDQPAARLSRSGRLVRAHDPRSPVLALVRGVGSLRARARQGSSAGMVGVQSGARRKWQRRNLSRDLSDRTGRLRERLRHHATAPAGPDRRSRGGERRPERRARPHGEAVGPRRLIAAEAGFRQTPSLPKDKEMSATAASSKLIKGATADWEAIVGLEVHAQVTSRAKLFSGASTAFGGEPNSHVSLVDAAMPGMLPVINGECVRQAVRTGLGLNAKINLKSVFDRKNYFYPDLPQGYQISQYKSPIVGEGEIQVELTPDQSIKVGIERLHLEQDAGKSLHDQSPTMSFVDLNRSGVALMEIVSKPDMRSADEAKAYVGKLRTLLRYIGSSDGDMEKGSLRADVNVSVRLPGAPLGTRCEIKNVNSIRFIGQAIDAEARRQIAILEDGGAIVQETRLYDPSRGETRSMRSKEEAHDYRYFPDPDLLPLELEEAWVESLRAELPELPDAKRARFVRQYGIPFYDAGV